jgi:SET family sugar efflux transporter-like MFS transporter
VTTNVTITFFQDRLPGQTGLATSIYSNSYAMGGLLGYLGFGQLVDRVGNRGVFLVSAALSAITLTIFLLYRHREKEIVATGVAS